MSETSHFSKPDILGLPPYVNPLADPETGTIESAFEPQPGETVPPADILAGVFPSKGEAYLPVPETFEEVQVLSGSIKAFYDRSSERSKGRLDAYQSALARKEDELDPPLGRFVRLFKEEVSGRYEGMDDFEQVLDKIFSGSQKPADETYRELANVFYEEPKAMVLFNIFTATAERHRFIRHGWINASGGKIYPRLTSNIAEDQVFSASHAAHWFAGAIKDAREVAAELASAGEQTIEYEVDEGLQDTYGVVTGGAWALFIRNYKRGSQNFMLSYDYTGFSAMTEGIGRRLTDPEDRAAFDKIKLDACRAIASHMLRQKMLVRKGPNNFEFIHTDQNDNSGEEVLRHALSDRDGSFSTREEFGALLREKLGVDIGPESTLYNLQSLVDELHSNPLRLG